MNEYYEIINETGDGSNKYTADILLKQKLSKDKISKICESLHKLKGKKCIFSHFSFYLPSQHPTTDDAWAVGIFNPHLQVELGLTITNEALLKKQINLAADDLGSWIDEIQEGATYTLKKEDSKFILAVNPSHSKGYRFCIVQDTKCKQLFENQFSEFGEMYFIDSEGNLQLYDQDGLIRTLKKIG
ncbi:hypothetical protein GKC30_11680 [Pseudodesulfovibrio sp. F-1]|uniref:Uncharacterized protein n=1 Tax=Pseudodesulfovibrio alkaliphilus TaxID=2661613 RepID=A0A7K1KQB6_9BACT|nr:hypothetical protein [Pseudodesulfovibrio alkaliphilus]MUM78295.1 hypothetical protein [Pseudodesulfovibrio alkaliphilus]